MTLNHVPWIVCKSYYRCFDCIAYQECYDRGGPILAEGPTLPALPHFHTEGFFNDVFAFPFAE